MPPEPPTLTSQLTDHLNQLAHPDVRWEHLADTYRLTIPLRRSTTTSDDTTELLAAAATAHQDAHTRLTAADPGDTRLHNRYAAQLLAAHRHPGWISYQDATRHPHPTLVPTDETLDLLPTWQTWIETLTAGHDTTTAYETAARATTSPTLPADTVADSTLRHISRWEGDLAALRDAYLTTTDTPTTLIIRRWRTRPLTHHPLLAAAIGRTGIHDHRGTALLPINTLIGHWVLRNPELHPLVRLIEHSHPAEITTQLDIPGTTATLDRLWAEQTTQLRADEDVATLHT